MSLGAYAVGTLVWVLVGYSIAFGDGDFIGTGKVMLSGITNESLSGTIPELLFVAFQGTFAAIAVAIASGSMIERVKLYTIFIIASLWVFVVYVVMFPSNEGNTKESIGFKYYFFSFVFLKA